MLKITQKPTPDAMTLRLEGRLTTAWIGEFERVAAAWLPRRERLRIDLSGLTYLDEAGIAALDRLRLAGVAVTGASAFLRELSKSLARDSRSIEEVVRTFGASMLATARRLLGDEREAGLAVQAAFATAFGADFPVGAEARSTWLQRLTIRAALARLNARPAAPECELDALLPDFDVGGGWQTPRLPNEMRAAANAALDGGPASQAFVCDCIDRIPTPYRTVLVLCDMEQLGNEETAELLAIPVEAVRNRLHRARMALCAMLEPVGSGGA